MDKWINVKESVPKKNGVFPSANVLVYCKNGYIGLGYFHNGKMNIACDFCSEDRIITHWMPLPNPPNEVEDG